MRKLIPAAVSIAAIAALAVPALASADVARYQTETGTLTAHVAYGDQSSVHTYKVTINPCDNTFSGKGEVTANGAGPAVWTESITGSFGDSTVSFATVPNAGATFKVTNAPYGTSTIAESTWTQNIVEMRASKPVITGTSDYKNHGDFVSSQGGGDDAAHSCIGMPIH